MIKNTMKTLPVLVVSVFIFLFWCVSAKAAINYCHDEDAGKFLFQVEQAIDVYSSGDVDMGAICPGCHKEWVCGDGGPVIYFYASGSLNCKFRMTVGPWSDPSPHVSLDYLMYYWNGTIWVPWTTYGVPVSFFDINHDGIGDYQWGAFISWWSADCQAVAQPYEYTLTCKVDYVCQ